MRFHPEDKKIKDIFGSGNIYQIPDFQRDYSWEKGNFEDFLQDLLTVSNATYNSHSHMLNINSIDDLEDYFFGTFLVIGDYSSSTEKRIVVDGQQRLTTMTLFLAAIRDIIENEKKEKNIEYAHQYDDALVVNITKGGRSSKYARVINDKLIPILPVNILNINDHRKNGTIHDPENEGQQLLLETYEWFKKQLSRSELAKRLTDNDSKIHKLDIKKINSIPSEDYLTFLDNLGNQLLKSTVIVIYSADEQSANIMYRNFNFRGLPLSGPDLIKNELFELLDDSTGSAKKLWTKVEQNVSIKESGSMSTFFIHYFSSKYKQASKKNLFPIFLNNVDAIISSYQNFLNEIVKESAHYKIIISPQEDDELFGEGKFFLQNDHPMIKRQLQKLNELEVTQVRTLLLGLFFARENKLITSKQFKKVIYNILLFQSLFVMSSSASNQIRGIYSKYGKIFRKNTNKDKVAKEINNLYKDLAAKIPSKESILKSDLNYNHKVKFEDMTKTQKKNKALIKLILTILSEEKQVESGQKNSNDSLKFISEASLEHIIDQSSDLESRYSLGNLILIEQRKHEDIEDKKEMYRKSEIIMTKSFSNQVDNFSTNQDIENRNQDILTQYYNYVKKQF
ncbi:hypothetical protein B14911_16895 [Bacillus sp. NRRL B-14911]|uniref:GmrSD restriction endonucleases N-terminal domain-containing protein n=1 Tax=Bacillus infantis NRRL B-14911 TaxID=1367477 RepID=U5L5Z1_9BACI|nr:MULTISPECIES: DUF262 domain-containing protein [Bacillus]AGX02768.1 hypothetical protein N288_04050 [Bacillus infantis NRRL B-14911]EAR67210.1 hypothetical protein B14911_16895 [Bacillus sp. NRRL B-14911]